MVMRALTDGAGRSFVDPVSGRMMVTLDAPLQIAAAFAGVGGLFAVADVIARPPPTPPPPPEFGKYVPLNAFVRRTIVRKRR
jgi:hypothetical protein